MLMVNVGLSAPKSSRLLKLFKDNKEIVSDGYSLDTKVALFLDDMCIQGFVREYVSDWGNQETTYELTDVGKDILRIKTTTDGK